MSEGFNIVGKLVGAEHPGLPTACLVAGGLVVTGAAALRSLKRAPNPLVPERELTLRNFFELVCQFILSLGDENLGRENRKYLPFCAALFLYLLSMNLIGLIPGFLPPTDQFQINLGVALIVFAMYNYWGIREVGIVAYLRHFMGPSVAVGVLMVFWIELLAHCLRPATLSLRLFGNMTGDHLALSTFIDLTKVGVPVAFYLLGTLVSFIQALVFTILAMVYIQSAVAHEEDH